MRLNCCETTVLEVQVATRLTEHSEHSQASPLHTDLVTLLMQSASANGIDSI
jgi:hypothetical protein